MKEHWVEISFVAGIVIKLILRKVGVDFLKLLRYVPLIQDVVEFLVKEAEKYELWEFKRKVEQISPFIYILVENMSKAQQLKGEQKLALFVEVLKKHGIVPQSEKQSLIVREVVEKINALQNIGEVAERIFKNVRENFPVISLLINFFVKILR